MSRDSALQHLHPHVVRLCAEHEMRVRSRLGIDCRRIETWRPLGVQASDYAKGRDVAGNIVDPSKVVTHVKAGMHNITYPPMYEGKPASFAWHLAPRLPGGGLLGFGDSKLDAAGRYVYKAIAQIGIDLGPEFGGYVRWGGDWDRDGVFLERGENDLIHFDFHQAGATMAQIVRAIEAQGDIHVLMGGA